MKTRIISACVAIAFLISVLILAQYSIIPLMITVCLFSALATYESLYNTTVNTYKPAVIAAIIYSALAPILCTSLLYIKFYIMLTSLFVCLMFAFAVFAHNKITINQTVISFALPIVISFAFACLFLILSQGLLYILLLCGFAWVTDTGAYFIGVFFGKHKVAPEISPKKTVEGCIGGIALCAVYTFVVSFIMMDGIKLPLLITVLSPIFAVAGMIGDLSASLLKRAYNIKDYGNIMPGHGGIMDRFDSILFISPCFLCVLFCI